MAKRNTRQPKPPAKSQPPAGGIAGYVLETRGLALSFLFIAPLLAAYELGLIVVQPESHSWAAELIRSALDPLLGRWSLVGFNVLVFAGLLAAFFWLNRSERVRARYFPYVLLESGVYAFFFGSIVLSLIDAARLLMAATWLPGSVGTMAENVVLSIGAGVYEEILFRLLLLGGLYYVLHKAWGMNAALAAGIAVVVSSVAFSACHHIQIDIWNGFDIRWSEQFTWDAFSYRLISGGVFSLIFVARGLAVAAYTHAFYDILVTAFR